MVFPEDGELDLEGSEDMNFPGNQNPQGANSNSPNDDPALTNFLNQMSSSNQNSASDLARSMEVRTEGGIVGIVSQKNVVKPVNKGLRGFLITVGGLAVVGLLKGLSRGLSRAPMRNEEPARQNVQQQQIRQEEPARQNVQPQQIQQQQIQQQRIRQEELMRQNAQQQRLRQDERARQRLQQHRNGNRR